jgi:hypothetical protein
MDSQQKRKEITELIDNIKKHSDRLSEKPNIPLLEVSVISAKVSRLNEKTAILKYLLAREQGFTEEEYAPQTLKEHERKIDEEFDEEVEEKEEELNNVDGQDEEVGELEAESQKELTKTNSEEEPILTAEQIEEAEVEQTEDETKQEKESIAEDVEAVEIKESGAILENEEIPSKPDLNEQYSEEEDPSLSEQLKKQPIADLLTAIGLNERYLYANELFGGDIEDFRNVVRTLNEFNSGEEAIEYFDQQLCVSYGWSTDNELVKAIRTLVQRRYQ